MWHPNPNSNLRRTTGPISEVDRLHQGTSADAFQVSELMGVRYVPLVGSETDTEV